MYGKIVTEEFAARQASLIRDSGRKVVFTNGCFDILHFGHVSCLVKARSLGDLLILGLNSDDSISGIKGPDRPINNQADRAAVLSALQCVDYIVIFGDPTPVELIRSIKPDILVKGGDYKAQNIVGYNFVKESGGEIVVIPFEKGYSTTTLIKRIKGS